MNRSKVQEEAQFKTEPSAVAPDPKVNFGSYTPVNRGPNTHRRQLLSYVDSSIRRYRARFCNHLANSKLTQYHLLVQTLCRKLSRGSMRNV